jgi:hypothetical protein
VNESEAAVEKILAAVHSVEGLRPATPVSQPVSTWLPRDWEGMAVDLEDGVVQVRVIALRLPLPPLLERASESMRPALAGTPWEHAKLRLVVTDIDGAAFTRE